MEMRKSYKWVLVSDRKKPSESLKYDKLKTNAMQRFTYVASRYANLLEQKNI